MCPEGCGYSTARRNDMLRHLNRRHMSVEGRKHSWVDDNQSIPKSNPIPPKSSTPTKQGSKGAEEEETVSRDELEETLKKLREERTVPLETVQGVLGSSVLETNSTECSPLNSTVATDVTNIISPTEFNQFRQWRAPVSTEQVTALNLNLLQQSPERENPPCLVKETTIIPKEEPLVSPLHLLNQTSPNKSTDRKVVSTREVCHLQKIYVTSKEYEYEVKDILRHRTVGRGNKKSQEVLVSWLGWSEDYNTWIPEKNLVSINQLPT